MQEFQFFSPLLDIEKGGFNTYGSDGLKWLHLLLLLPESLFEKGWQSGYTWKMKKNQRYPSDLTDRQWDCIKDLIPPAKSGGRPRELDMRSVVNALLYVLVTGCQWRMLPREYPAWQSVYTYFGQWRDDGTGPRIHDTLRAQVRQRAGRQWPRSGDLRVASG